MSRQRSEDGMQMRDGIREAHLYRRLGEGRVQCQTCAHYCVLKVGERGRCGVKGNIDGKLYTLVYGKACAANIDHIEKKPFFHFLPGSSSYSIATVGCQFQCKNCQNWQISQGPKLGGEIWGQDLAPDIIVTQAKAYHCDSISYTYTDPIVFSEYALDTMRIAQNEGIKNLWVSSGFWSKELFDMVSPYVDATNIDLKYFSDRDYKEYSEGRLKPVLDTIKRVKRKGIWLELTTLVIPTISDTEEVLEAIANFIKNELGPDTPWHVSHFSGAISWKLRHLPDTPVEVLIKAREIGLSKGLKYVYIGNVAGIQGESTFCPNCKAKVIERIGYSVKRFDENGKCSRCGEDLNLTLS